MLQTFTPDLHLLLPVVQEAGLFSSLCTLRKPDGVITPAGQPSGNYIDVPGMVAIPCMNAPVSTDAIQATEVKQLEDIMALNIRHVLLNGYFPAIPNDTDWIAVIDGQTFDILGAESDSQKTMTRMKVRTAKI